MFGVVLVGGGLIGLDELQGLDAQALSLETEDHFAGKSALECIGLNQDESL